MPELPEVEITCRGIAPYLQDAVVTGVVVREGRLRWPVLASLSTTLAGLTIRKVARRAKYLLFSTDAGTLMIHLGMSGSLRFLQVELEPEKHDHIDIVFGSNILRYRDPRRFGAVLWHVGPVEFHPLLASLGPEPLSDEFGGEVLYQASRKRASAVKLMLMDNHVVVGVGNIYANEALFHAGICPTRAANQIQRHEYELLAVKVRQVLLSAIEAGGSTLRDFVDSRGKPGYFQQSYKVYGRQDQPCRECGTPIRHLRQGQRSTFYCPLCQSC
ncbi:bifunctional DNA-formamidopyrimidine glycosylase/DNA-(apurinic or apyrimidinic site) lyase [Neisseriaceae bacterium TC5R-5]|nr:bifunctional DNA-formamidopyrimidine glycosylase/DNA-(apurinic or apyrimidinic site) lyase [Neisseriaceae bacterium TC5R-5]